MKKYFLIAYLAFLSFLSHSQIIRIPQDFLSIQEGINLAEPGDTILVDEGVYQENLVVPQKELTIGSLYLTTGDTSYVSKTIIDGNQNGPVVHFGPGDYSDNIFTGFTVKNGNGEEGIGGGINIAQSSPVLDHLKITTNAAIRGGAIACMGPAELNLRYSELSNNMASNRGAGIQLLNSGLNMNHCIISDNTLTGGIGGAVYFSVGSGTEPIQAKISSTTIENNAASGTGATAGTYFENPTGGAGLIITLEDCLFQDNVSIGNTGLRIHGQQTTAQLINCTFLSNEARQYGAGAVFTNGVSGEVINSLFISNRAGTDGGEWNSGAVTVWNSDIDFYNCTFNDNTAYFGSALTIGAAGEASLTNCILWDNGSDQIALVDGNQTGSTLSVSYSNIRNSQISADPLSQLIYGNGNIDADPLFLNEGDHPYSLGTGSPCIDTGDPDTDDFTFMITDILGNNRIWDGDGDETAVADMGPYEYGSVIIVNITETGSIQKNDLKVSAFPNPFFTSVTFEYKLTHHEEVILTFLDQSGRLMDNIHENQSQGSQKIIWTPENLPAGIYYFRLQAGDQTASGKIIVTK